MNDKSKYNAWLISILVILILFSVFLLMANREEDEAINTNTNKVAYKIVENYSNFYTVNSCVYRYLTYLQAKDTDALLKVLDDDYKNNNSMTKDNLYNYLNLYEGNLTFNSKKMYEEKINSSITKYYVSGNVENDIMDEFPEVTAAYFIVKLDTKNQVFTIQPYNGEIFKQVMLWN